MSKTLFEEAVADANKLRELAEETAKNRVVEAVMPQIRDLINRKILGEDIDIESDLDVEALIPEEELESDDAEPDHTDVSIGSSEKSPEVHISVDGDVEIDLDIEGQESDEELVMDQAMAEALGRLIRGEEASPSLIETRVQNLEKTVTKLSVVMESLDSSLLTKKQANRLKLSYMHCMREALRLRAESKSKEDTTQEGLEARLTETIKEIRKMSKSNRRNIFDFLFEGEDEKKKMEELEEAELSLELTADEQEELADAEDADAVGDTLEDILGDIELSLDAGAEAEEGEEPEAEAGEEPEAEAGEEGGDEEEEELDLEEGMYEGEVYEIDENMLRRELQRMNEEAVDADPALAHGGEEVGDVLLDVSEEDLINALADELGTVSDSPAAAPAVATESRRSRRALSEARREISQYKKAIVELKGQLVEMNLFNAKLLYANKLMQNKDLTLKQQKAIVEALDNAKTLREAKLLFKSLTESLNRRTRKNKLNEGSLRTIGSSSRSTRSGAPAKSGVEVDRWAVLAGLNED